MITNFIYILVSILSLRVIYNIYYLFLTKIYYKKYKDYLKGSKDWFLTEHKQKIIKLFKNAGIGDTTRPDTEPAGYGLVRTSNFSVLQNITVLREDIIVIINSDFRESIGIYKQRIFDTFNPFFWIEVFFHLPTEVFKFLGIGPEKIIVKIFQILWWIIVAISTIVGILFNNEFINWLKQIKLLK